MSRSRTHTLLASATAVLLVVALSAVADASSARVMTTTIRGVGSTYSSPHWSPTRVRIQEGSRVRWRAVSFNHFVVAYGGNWTFRHALPQGTSVKRLFPDAGTFRFRCRIHSTLVNGSCQGMCGKIVVH